MREAAHQYLYTLANSYTTEITTPLPVWRVPASAGRVILYVLAIAGIVVIVRRKKVNQAV